MSLLLSRSIFFIDDEPKYDVFDFNDIHSVDFNFDVISVCDTFAISLDLKPLLESVKYAFLGPDKSLLKMDLRGH